MTPLAELVDLVTRERDRWAAVADDPDMHEGRRLQAAHERDALKWALWQAEVIAAAAEVGPSDDAA